MIAGKKYIVVAILSICSIAVFTACEKQKEVSNGIENVDNNTSAIFVENETIEQNGITINNETEEKDMSTADKTEIASEVEVVSVTETTSVTDVVEITENAVEKRTVSEREEQSTADVLEEAIRQLEELDAILSE